MQRKGSALLIAILLTSVLTLLTVSLSELISSETRQIGQLIRNGKAQYLAEAGSEVALYTVHHSDPGFEPVETNNKPIVLSFKNENPFEQFSYSIDAKTSHIPIVEDYIVDLVDEQRLDKSYLFDELLINESITIPLESDRFEVQYYLPVKANIRNIQDWDILLWKIFGKNPANNDATDSMSNFLPASDNDDSSAGSSAISPARFGTEGGFNKGSFFAYSSGDVADIPSDEARPKIFISEFIGAGAHVENTLILKNAVNPGQIDLSAVGRSVTFEEASTLKFRVCTPNCSSPDPNDEGLVPEFTTIASSGNISGVERRLLTSVNREGFLPIFDFSIYRTVN